MRHLEDREFDDLHVVIRTFCKDNNLYFTAFAGRVADRVKASALAAGESEAEANDRAAPVAKAIDKFLTSAQNKFMQTLAPFCLEILAEEVAAAKPADSAAYHRFIAAFGGGEAGEYRKADGVVQFLDERVKNIVSARKKDARKGKKGARPEFTKRLSRLYHLAAVSFEKHDDDVNAFDKRIGDSRYLAVRAHSRKPGQYVVHGLRFAPHVDPDSSDLCYFSDKYTLKRSPDEPSFGRKSQGVCFVEGQYVSAVGRPDINEAAFTYVHVKLPAFTLVDETPALQDFEAMVSATNTVNERFWAKALCFRCKDKEEKHAKVGIYTFDGLLEQFEQDQRAQLEDWRSKGKFKVLTL